MLSMLSDCFGVLSKCSEKDIPSMAAGLIAIQVQLLSLRTRTTEEDVADAANRSVEGLIALIKDLPALLKEQKCSDLLAKLLSLDCGLLKADCLKELQSIIQTERDESVDSSAVRQNISSSSRIADDILECCGDQSIGAIVSQVIGQGSPPTSGLFLGGNSERWQEMWTRLDKELSNLGSVIDGTCIASLLSL